MQSVIAKGVQRTACRRGWWKNLKLMYNSETERWDVLIQQRTSVSLEAVSWEMGLKDK